MLLAMLWKLSAMWQRTKNPACENGGGKKRSKNFLKMQKHSPITKNRIWFCGMYRFLLRDLFKAYSIVYNPFFDLEKHFFFSTLFLFNPLREDNTVIMTEKKHDVTGTVIKNRAAYHNWLKTPRLKNVRSYRDLTSKTPLPIHALYKSTKSHKMKSKSKFVIS